MDTLQWKRPSASRSEHVSIGKLVGTVTCLALGGLLLVGCSGGGDNTATTGQTTTPPTTSPGSTMPSISPRGTGATVASATPATNVKVELGPNRQDPFRVPWTQPPPPPNPFDDVQPIRVASVSVEIPPSEPVQVREVADRRVSGIMSGDGVFAIIEQSGESEVVKPGSTTRDGYRVIAINDDSVKLERRDGNIIRTQVVQLSDATTGPTQGAGMGFPGGFGGPGRFGGGGGRPGFGGGRFGGGGKQDGSGGAD